LISVWYQYFANCSLWACISAVLQFGYVFLLRFGFFFMIWFLYRI